MGGRAFDNTIEVRIDRLRCLLTIPVDEPPVQWMDTQELTEMAWFCFASPKESMILDTEVDGLDFGCSSNAITGSPEVG